MKLRFRLISLFTIIGLVGAEVGVRLAGLVDFPLYEANPVVGYIPAANQSGSFLNKNAWRFNAQHMGAAAFEPGSGANVLLVGDSLVLGGNPYREVDRLAPSLQALLPAGSRVWPISAGSWALRNELAWLRSNPDVVNKVSAIVFVVNSGDFAEASSWSCELTHPTQKPTLALLYLFEKYVHAFSPCDGTVPVGLQVPPGDLPSELQAFLNGRADKVHFVWYADKPEQADAQLRQTKRTPQFAILKAAGGAKHLVSVADDPRWSAAYYRDGIHATPEGNRVLADIIKSDLVRAGVVADK